MQSDDPQNVMAASGEASLPYAIVETLLHDRLRNSIAPISLEVDCLALKNWSRGTSHERFRHQHLIRELRLWSSFLLHRPVSRLWLNDPFAIMDAPSLTELVYAIGQNLKLLQGHHVEHTITLASEAITRQNIALLRGLEFNHIQVKLHGDCNREKIQHLQQLLMEFKFSFISFELEVQKDASLDALRIMELLSFLAPATLVLNSEGLELSGIEHLAPMLMQFGYYFQAPNLILKFHSPLYNRPADYIGLGPASKSRLAGLCISNLSQPATYLAHLKENRLPIARCL